MKRKFKATEIAAARSLAIDEMRLQTTKTTAHSERTFTAVFDIAGNVTILAGNCNTLVDDPCIEFDVRCTNGQFSIAQNRFYNIERISTPDLQKLFTKEEWLQIMASMNGILSSPELPAQENLAGNMDNDDLAKKIRALSDIEARSLLEETEKFWS